jgi:hypothetical protein
MKKWMVMLLGPSLLGLIPLSAQVPIILSQPSMIKVCDGDSVRLEVIVLGQCDAQWFTASHNGGGYFDYNELPGENSFKLTIRSVSHSKIPSNQYFLLRLTTQTDTIWSGGICLFITHVGKPLEDTVSVNHFPGMVSLFNKGTVLNTQLVWSTGDTTSVNGTDTKMTFLHSGKYWATTYQQNCSRTDTFEVVECPPVIHLNDSTPLPKCWCADTIYIDDNISPGVITVKPGTTITFTGDYSLNSGYMDLRGTDNDSIFIIGSYNPDTKKWMGSLYSQDLSPTGQFAPTQSKYLMIKHMKYVHMFRAGSATFYRNNRVSYYDVTRCVFYQNKQVEITYRARYCTFLENDSVTGWPCPFPRGGISYFIFENNAFHSNKSGLKIEKDNTSSIIGPVHVFNCSFRNNLSTPLTTWALTNYIDQNVFAGNVCDSGSSVLQCNFSEVTKNHYTYCHDLVFRNNTLLGNSGRQDIAINIPDASPFGGRISNNIFWNAPHKNVKSIKSDTCKNHLSIDHNCFSSDSSAFEIPIDTNISFKNNYFATYPDFSDTLKADFSLQDTSFLIDKGSDIDHGPVLGDLYFVKDFAGFPRKFGTATDPGAFEFHGSSPMSFQYVTPDTLVCQGDTFTLKAIPSGKSIKSSYTYKWYWNGNVVSRADSAQLMLGPGMHNLQGIYEVEVSNGTDTMRAGPILVTFVQKPSFDEQPASHIVCPGNDIKLEIRFPQETTMQYNWTSVRHGNIFPASPVINLRQVTDPDTIYVTASNNCGSAVSDPILLFIAPLPAPSLGPDTTLHAGDSLLLDAGEGVLYAWSSGDTSPQVYGYPNDTAWVTVTNAYGCTGSDTIVISVIPVGIKEPGADGLFVLYPNPAGNRLFIQIPDDADFPCRMQMVGGEGSVVRETIFTSAGIHEVYLSNLEKGVYFVRIQSKTHTETRKIVLTLP